MTVYTIRDILLQLALIQTKHVIACLQKLNPDVQYEIREYLTKFVKIRLAWGRWGKKGQFIHIVRCNFQIQKYVSTVSTLTAHSPHSCIFALFAQMGSDSYEVLN